MTVFIWLWRAFFGFWTIMFAAVTIALLVETKFGAAIFAMASAALAFYIGIGFQMQRRAKQRRLAKRAELAALAQRADQQNEAFMAGDPWGIYGEYR